MSTTSNLPKSTNVNRRDALKKGLLGAAGLAAAALPGTLGATTPSPGTRDLAAPFTGETALVTGAARGIGRAIALELARQGADILAFDLAQNIPGWRFPMASSSDLAETKRLVEATGVKCLAVEGDIRNIDSLKAAIGRISRAGLSPLKIVAANAGVDSQVAILDTPEDDFLTVLDTIIDINVKGTANTIRAAADTLRSNGNGRVIVTASTFGRHGNAGNPAYVTSKWALIGLMKSAAAELGGHGVRVNAICPTGVVTGINGTMSAKEIEEANKFFSEQYHTMNKGILYPEDVAGTAAYLASHASRYVSGAAIDVAAGANARWTA